MSTVQAAAQPDRALSAKILLMEDTIRCLVESVTDTGAVVVVPRQVGVPSGFFLETGFDGLRRFVSVAARSHVDDRAEIRVEFRTKPLRVWA